MAKILSKNRSDVPKSRKVRMPIDEVALKKYGHSLYQNMVARERGYAARRYQVTAAVRAVSLAFAGNNSAIELPPGTGKTLIACLAVACWKKIRPLSRIILIVPSRTLVVQHADVARWIMQELTVSRIEDAHSGDPGAIRSAMLRADLLITTPGILASALRRHVVDDDYVKSIEFVIVDEFDSFVVSDENETETEVRFAASWSAFKAQLSPRVKFLIKSATLNLGQEASQSRGGAKSVRRARKIADDLKPVSIPIPEIEYSAIVPYQSIREVVCSDSWIAELASAVSSSKGILHARLDEMVGGTDYNTVERTAPYICQKPARLPLRYRTYSADVRKQIIGLYCGIAALKMMPQHIFEDLTRGLGTKVQSAAIKTSGNKIIHVTDGIFLDDGRINSRFEFQPGMKTRMLLALLRGFNKKKLRSVVFCRTIRLLEALKDKLRPLKVELYELTGEMPDEQRGVSIRNFRRSQGGVLLMTRATGGRGLDLPFADCAVFFSPKTEAVQMWQEMSRIRSTVSVPKETFVLCYRGTVESEVLASVVLDLMARRLNVDDSPPALERFIRPADLEKLK